MQSSERKLVAWLSSVPAILIFLIQGLGHGPVFVDDAYIFYRYAANWAAGHGLVYNIGEHVEGFSSLLWTVALAVGARLSLSPEVLAPTLGLLLGAVCLLILHGITAVTFPGSPALRVALPVACALSTGFTYYAVSGMDTILFATVLLATVAGAQGAIAHGRIGSLSVGLVALVLVRVEGPLYSIALLAVLAIPVVWNQTMLARGAYVTVTAVTLTAVILQVVGRAVTYEAWIPATVSAKAYTLHTLEPLLRFRSRDVQPFLMALTDGMKYEAFLIPVTIIPFLVLGTKLLRKQPPSAVICLFATPILLSMLITVAASGDWMEYHRHIVPVWPLSLLFLAWGLQKLGGGEARPPRLARAVIVLAVLASGVYAIEAPINSLGLPDGAAFQERGRGLYKRQIGHGLRQLDQRVILVTNVAGRLPYHAGPGTYVRDLLGLTDAHNSKHGNRWSPTYGRTDYEYSFGRPFDLLVSNSFTDLEYLLAYWDAHPASRTAYALYARREWTASCFFVVARSGHPVAAMVRTLCECEPEMLDHRYLQVVRSLRACSGEDT